MKKGHATGTECLIDVWSSAWEQWLSKSCRIVGDTKLQASQGKDFHQKLTISDDSKMSFDLCNMFLGLSSSVSQLGMVKHVKFDHVLDTIFCWFWAESVQCEMVRGLHGQKSKWSEVQMAK